MRQLHSLGLSDSACIGISAAEAAWADAIYSAAQLISLLFPAAAPELIPMAVQNDIAIASGLGVIENRLGNVSFGATATSDWLAGYTYIADNGDWYVGKDTLVSLTTTAVGLIPESNLDAAASVYQFSYDTAGTNGQTGGSLNISNITSQRFLSIFPTNFSPKSEPSCNMNRRKTICLNYCEYH